MNNEPVTIKTESGSHRPLRLLDSLTVPLDERILIVNSLDEIAGFEDQTLKGGLYEGAMPQSVMDDILLADPEALSHVTDTILQIPPSRYYEFPAAYGRALAPNTLAFFADVAYHTNGRCGLTTNFNISTHLSKRETPKVFHPESKIGDRPRVDRFITCVSSDPEGQKHETELLMTDGLNHAQVKVLLKNGDLIEDLPDFAQGRVGLTHSGDITLLRGLGDFKTDPLTDAFLHRAPPHKRTLDKKQQRFTISWYRYLPQEIDLG